MGKQIAIYVGIFVVVFALISTTLFIVFNKKQAEPPELPTTEIDSTASVADTTSQQPIDSLAMLRPDTLVKAITELPDPLLEYNNLMMLRKRLIEFYSEGEIRAYSSSEIDSLFTGFVAQIDSLAYKQQQYIAKINELSRVLLSASSHK
ncbi:MAG: hypothetical protein K8R90_01590 [Candidatus Cloacimonetes bacterium]|nr:hypothetical protein [Candidatus Cloacimonadota bacterium]